MRENMEKYIDDLLVAQKYAAANREMIIRQLVREMKWSITESIITPHNYIAVLPNGKRIVRKGAISANKDENMRDGILLCRGKGNPEWNFSAPHGAGRLMSRKDAKESISMADYRNSMEGIYTSSVNNNTIDESPMAYKPMDEIIANIKDTVYTIDVWKPVYIFKSSAKE